LEYVVQKVDSKFSNELFNSNEVKNFISNLKNFNLKYIAAMKETETKLNILNEDFKTRYKHSPIDHIESRIKTPTSLIKKMIKNNVAFDFNEVELKIKDIAGVRVICPFIDDIFTIVDMVEKNEDIEVIKKKDYINNPKESGYRSYHMILKVPVFLTTGREEVIVELQIRTMAMDFWASLEHQIKYKYDGIIPSEVHQELIECASAIEESDKQMLKLNKRVKQINGENN
jgi:putative GTP pyrophosphokinase